MLRMGFASTVMLLAFAASCVKAQPEVERKPTAVRVKKVERAGTALESRYSGSLEPTTQVSVAFRASGYVSTLGMVGKGKDARALDVGDSVKKGTVLARLRSADYAQKVVSAKAHSAEARASARLAEQELERAKKLFDAQVISKAEMDAKTAQQQAALAGVDGAEAMIGEASLALDDTVLKAPMDGVILARSIELGTLVNPGTVAFVIADTSSVKVVFGAPQSLVQRLQVGGPLSVSLPTTMSGDPERGAQRALATNITRIAPAADSHGRLFTIEASLRNQDSTLRPGSVVTIHVPDAELGDDSLVIPLGAIVRSPSNDRGFAVFVVDGSEPKGPARLQEVALGDVVGNGVTVTTGLNLGDRVVTTGATHLVDGGSAIVIP